jgi:hypothetical protein
MPSVRVMPADLSGRRVRVGSLDGFAVAVTEAGELILRLPTRSAEFRRRLKAWGCVVVAGPLPRVRAVRAHGTRFQLKVWQACQRIHPGETVTYGALARAVGCRSAQANPPAPDTLTTRWQGIRMAKGLAPRAEPTAWADRQPTARASAP